MAKKRDVHVVPHRDGGWATRTEGASRVGSRHRTQGDAIDRARSQAVRQQIEVVIHRRNGQIRNSDSYGNDPNSPLDKKH